MEIFAVYQALKKIESDLINIRDIKNIIKKK